MPRPKWAGKQNPAQRQGCSKGVSHPSARSDGLLAGVENVRFRPEADIRPKQKETPPKRGLDASFKPLTFL
jgi:hypothetical protein